MGRSLGDTTTVRADMRVEHRFFAVNGLRLHTIDYGGEGRPIVLVHGVTGHGWMWRDIAAPLSLWGRVIAVDLRGHGDSQWSADERYGTNDHADDLWSILQAVAGEPADLVGLEWGGLVALRVAAGAPEVVRHLVVLDVPPSFDRAATDVPELPYEFPDHGAVVAWEQGANPRASAGLVEHLATHSTRPGAGGSLVRKHDPFFTRVWPFHDEDSWNDLRCVSVPTLLVRAADSPVLSEETFAAMGEALPGARCQTVSDSGHLIPLENPLELVDQLGEFFVDVALSGAKDLEHEP
jgi:pimeloyl-ACP methyl ester carboxylesterase